MKSYRLANRQLHPTGVDLQIVLAHAYAQQQRLMCGCRQDVPVELYIAKVTVRNAYELRRMPGTGSKHASECDHYEPPEGLSGLAQVQGHAILEHPESDLVELKLDFALSKMSGRTLPTPKDTPPDSVKSDGTKLTLRGLLHYLWHTAGFDKWYPAMAGKRTYGTFFKYINHAALGKVAKAQPLGEMLYVPEPFDGAREKEARSRRMLRLAKLASRTRVATKLGLVVGELYEFRSAQFGHHAIFKNAPDCPFRVNEDLHKRMVKHFEAALTMWDQHLDDSHLILIGTFTVDATGMPALNEVAVMNVTSHWIPFENLYEKTLIDNLVDSKRVFWKSLRFNLPLAAPMANVVLTDTSASNALCILPPGAQVEDQEQLASLVGVDGVQTWFWRSGEEEMPQLPRAHGA
jgi:hypothetical protein